MLDKTKNHQKPTVLVIVHWLISAVQFLFDQTAFWLCGPLVTYLGTIIKEVPTILLPISDYKLYSTSEEIMSLNSLIMITDDTMKKLKCDVCHNYLSFFPIFISNGKNICGRFNLHPQEKSELEVNKTLEIFAELIEFPCQYEKEGCFEKCFPKNIIQHEKTCPFRIIKCPTRHISTCIWEGALPTVLDHCQNEHNDLMLKDGNFELNLAETYQRENLLKRDSALYLVSQNFNSLNKLMKINIRYPDYVYDIKENSWKITFETIKRELNIRMDTHACEDHKNTMIYLDNFVNGADSREISVKGKIMEDKKIENRPAFSEEENDEFLAMFKCSSCSNYALPPIYEVTVSNGETKKGVQCTKCRSRKINKSTVQRARNYALDKIAEKLTFPCENHINGCTFKSKPSSVINHHSSCSYTEYDCPVSEFVPCAWKGFGYDIPNHIEEIHSDLILKTPTLSLNVKYCQNKERFVLSENEITCHIIKFLKSYFRLIFFQNGDEFYWEVQFIGPKNVKFNYEIEMISRENENKCLRTRHSCLTWLARTMEQMLRMKNCYFNYRQIRDFIELSDGAWYLNFNVKIFK